MNFTLHQLQIYLKVVEKQSITKASNDLFLTQPAISIQLKNFQDQFEFPLIDVVGKKVCITDFGKDIALAAQRILQEIETIKYSGLIHQGKLFGRLKISVVSTAKYVMPYFLSDFLNENDGVELSIDVTNKQKVVESLERNEVDFALVSVLPKGLLLHQEILMENRLYLIGNHQSEFKNKRFDKEDFKNLPLIYRESGSATRQAMERFVEKNKISVKKKIELTSNEAVKQAVIAGLGYSIMPLIGIKNELLNQELNIISVENLPIKTQWHLVWNKNKTLSAVAQSYIDYLQKNKQDIIQNRFEWYEKFNN
jgi:DNA-binding transcriptional LysR family regulator